MSFAMSVFLLHANALLRIGCVRAPHYGKLDGDKILCARPHAHLGGSGGHLPQRAQAEHR